MLDFEKGGGTVPVVVQDDESGEVLMVAYMDQAAFDMTLEKGLATFASRSKGRLWTKGEQSGHVLRVTEIRTDCDQDAVLLKVRPVGPGVCHEGYRSCFFRKLDANVWAVDGERAFDPADVYGGKG